jgi:hypothetical protein
MLLYTSLCPGAFEPTLLPCTSVLRLMVTLLNQDLVSTTIEDKKKRRDEPVYIYLYINNQTVATRFVPERGPPLPRVGVAAE